MKFSNKKIWIGVFCLFSLICLCLAAFYIAILLQYPPVRADLLFVSMAILAIVGSIASVYATQRLSKTKIQRQTWLFLLFLATLSLLVYLWGNLIFKMSFPLDLIVTFSVIVSTILSCVVTGYSTKDITKRLKRIGWNKGITLIVIAVLSIMPIIEYPSTTIVTLDVSGVISPSSVFQRIENSSYVTSVENNSGLFIELPLSENLSREAKIGDVFNPVGYSLTLRFYILSFSGNYCSLKKCLFNANLSSAGKLTLLSINNGLIHYYENDIWLNPEDTVSLSINYIGENTIDNHLQFALVLSFSCHPPHGNINFKENLSLTLNKTN